MRRLDALFALLAALVWLSFASTLRDVPAYVALPHAPVAPPVPKGQEGDARLRVEVTSEDGAAVTSAVVSIFTLRDDRAYLAASLLTDAAGVAEATSLPRGETWVLAEATGRQRASTKLVLLADPAAARLVLRRASKLVVRVTDEEVQPIAGARIDVRGGDPLPFAATTGADGKAELARLGTSPWSVRVWAPGYELVTRTSVSSASSPLHVTLRKLGGLDVMVALPSGDPAIGATVLVAGSGLWPARRATTDAAGKVLIGGLAAGAYDLSASQGELISETMLGTPLARGETRSVKLTLGPGRRVTVKAIDEAEGDAQIIKGARVVLAEDGLTSFPREGITGDDGTITLGPITSRPASVFVRADGFVARGMLVPAQLDGPLVVGLVRGATLLGDVVDDRDFPVAGASIEIVGIDFAGMPVDETPENRSFRAAHFAWALPGPSALIPAGELGVMPGPLPHIPPVGTPVSSRITRPSDEPPPEPWITNKDGRFRASPVPPGRLRAIVRHPGFVEGISEVVTLGPGAEGHVKIVLRAGATLAGRVVDHAGHPVAGARVEIAATHGSLVRSTLTADDGTFAFASVPAEISVTVARPDTIEAPVLRKNVSLAEQERKELTLTLPEPRDAMSVRVLDDRRYPLANAQVSVLALTAESTLRTTRFTAEDGTASVPDAVGLSLRINVTLPGFAPLSQTLDKADRELVLTLRRGVTVTGEVRTRGGREPLEGADVTLYAQTGARHGRTDPDGRYTLKDLPPGKARLVIARKGYAKIERTITIGDVDPDQIVTVDRQTLEESGTVEGEVVDASGDPVPGARVAVDAAPAYLPIGPLPPGVAITNAKGKFTLTDVPEGDVVLEAYASERGRGRERAVRVRRGETTRDVRIRLDEESAAKESPAAGGVAITLGESGARTKRTITILHVAPGSEAERAGLMPDDVIRSIDRHAPESLEDARKRLSGPLGDDVILELVRDGEGVTVRLSRERVRR